MQWEPKKYNNYHDVSKGKNTRQMLRKRWNGKGDVHYNPNLSGHYNDF
jgi:hypothetical protein